MAILEDLTTGPGVRGVTPWATASPDAVQCFSAQRILLIFTGGVQRALRYRGDEPRPVVDDTPPHPWIVAAGPFSPVVQERCTAVPSTARFALIAPVAA